MAIALPTAISIALTAGLLMAPNDGTGEKASAGGQAGKSVYDFTVKDIGGTDVALSKYKGDVLLIVNVASR